MMVKNYYILVLIMLSVFSVMALAEDQGLNKAIKISIVDLKLTPVEKAWLKDHQSIEIGGPKSFPPFHYFEEDGVLKGISAAYINAIMNQVGVKVNVQSNLPWPEVLKRAESGKIDLIPCIAKTDEREKFLSFSSPYFSCPLVIINRKDMPFVGGVEDLAGKKLAVVRKILTIEWLKRDGINFIPYYVESPLKGLEAVSFGEADAQIENLAVASYLIQKYGLTNLKIAAPTHYEKYNLYMAVRKDLPELLGIINKALDAISPEQHIQIRNKLLSVRYEHGIKKINVFLWVIGITGVASFFVVFVLFWNKRLKREIIEKEKVENALKESERRLSTLIDNLPGIAYRCLNDANCTMLYLSNGCYELTGYEPFELVKNQILSYGDLIVEEDRQYVQKEVQTAIEERRAFAVEYRIRDKNKNIKWIWEKGQGIFDEKRNLSSLEGFITDITELKNAQEEKIKAQRFAGEQKKLALVGQVAGKMAHDFNNILGIIMGNTELSLMDCKDEATKKTLELIFDQTIRGKNLTRNLVAFAKDQEPKKEFFRINEKIDLVINLLKKNLEGIDLIKEYKPEVPEMLADPGMIEHALINLIQNSIHATSMNEHSGIIIRTFCLDNNICFEIEDNGCGIPEEHIENIYEPSFTLKGTRDVTGSYKAGIKGTGYGMANVKKYIEQHKGNISVDSEFNMGTKFTISLPVTKNELTNEEKAEIRKGKIFSDKTILLVEDEPAISGIQYKILSQEPFSHTVDLANTGQIAMDLFDSNKYNLASLDYMLPGKINGIDVYNHIRKTDDNIPILFISGNIEFLESIKDLKQKDAHIDHLSKPCQNKDYVDSINKLLERALAAKE